MICSRRHDAFSRIVDAYVRPPIACAPSNRMQNARTGSLCTIVWAIEQIGDAQVVRAAQGRAAASCEAACGLTRTHEPRGGQTGRPRPSRGTHISHSIYCSMDSTRSRVRRSLRRFRTFSFTIDYAGFFSVDGSSGLVYSSSAIAQVFSQNSTHRRRCVGFSRRRMRWDVPAPRRLIPHVLNSACRPCRVVNTIQIYPVLPCRSHRLVRGTSLTRGRGCGKTSMVLVWRHC